MSKVVLRKDVMTIQANKITLNGKPVTVTGEFYVDKDNRIIHESDNKH